MHLSVGAVRASALALLLGAASCAPRPSGTAMPAAQLSHADGAGFGTVVAVRPVAAAGGDAGGAGIRATLLGALGGGSPEGAAAGGQVEVIVREDAGPTVSVMLADDMRLAPGERVVITGGARARLARGAPPAAGS